MANPVYVTRSSLPPMDEYINEIRDIWDSHWLTNMGAKHTQLEGQLRRFLNSEGVSLFANGHLALELGVQALRLTGEVITTPYTFASTTHAIVRNGLDPVFVDVDPDTFTMDPSKIEDAITDRTSAILPVHVYGNICDTERIDQIAKKYSLKVIYDAAHAFGITRAGRSVAEFGDVSMFSFHATKAFNSIEGGALTYHGEEFGLDLARLRNFGIRGEETVDYVGANAKMNEFAAAMGICNLRRFSAEREARQYLDSLYRDRLADIQGIRLSELQADVASNYSYFPILVDPLAYGHSRNELRDFLVSKGYHPRKYFYPLTSDFDCYRGRFDPHATPVAMAASKRVLTLPLYASLESSDVETITRLIRDFHA